MATAARTDDPNAGVRKLPIWGYVLIVVVYLAIIQGLNYALTRGDDTQYGVFRDSQEVWANLFPPLLVAFVFVYVIVAALGWWRPVFIDRKPVQRWVWIVPGLMIFACVAGMYYGGLADRGAGFILALALSTLLVGFGEEGMFRGLGVTAFRVNGYGEWKVALWTCVLFGLAHGTNIVSEGSRVVIQVLVTAAAGFFLYLVRRVSGGLVLAALVHGLWDFALFSGNIKEDYLYPGAAVFMATDVLLVVILLVRRKHIDPEPAAPGVPAPAV